MVVTLKELDGVNRHDVFMRNCAALGWSVNEIEVDNQIDIYEEGQTEIEWE